MSDENVIDENINELENYVDITDVSDSIFDDFSSEMSDVDYDLPENVDGFVDVAEGKIIKKEDMTPFEIIKSIAKQNNTEIKDPSKGCKHCYGKGYEGLETKTKMPIPCRCIFRGKTPVQKENDAQFDTTKMFNSFSRKQKRRMKSILKSQVHKKVRIDDEDETIDQTILNTYVELNSLEKTAKLLNLTLTKVKKIVKSNKHTIDNIKEQKGIS